MKFQRDPKKIMGRQREREIETKKEKKKKLLYKLQFDADKRRICDVSIEIPAY